MTPAGQPRAPNAVSEERAPRPAGSGGPSASKHHPRREALTPCINRACGRERAIYIPRPAGEGGPRRHEGVPVPGVPPRTAPAVLQAVRNRSLLVFKRVTRTAERKTKG